jgi:hypothetical protein
VWMNRHFTRGNVDALSAIIRIEVKSAGRSTSSIHTPKKRPSMKPSRRASAPAKVIVTTKAVVHPSDELLVRSVPHPSRDIVFEAEDRNDQHLWDPYSARTNAADVNAVTVASFQPPPYQQYYQTNINRQYPCYRHQPAAAAGRYQYQRPALTWHQNSHTQQRRASMPEKHVSSSEEETTAATNNNNSVGVGLQAFETDESLDFLQGLFDGDDDEDDLSSILSLDNEGVIDDGYHSSSE